MVLLWEENPQDITCTSSFQGVVEVVGEGGNIIEEHTYSKDHRRQVDGLKGLDMPLSFRVLEVALYPQFKQFSCACETNESSCLI